MCAFFIYVKFALNIESPLEFNAVQLYTNNTIKKKREENSKKIMTARIGNVNISERYTLCAIHRSAD